MRKIGEGDDACFTHAHGFAQHGLRIAQVLQGIDLQHHIEAAIGKQCQAVF